MGLLYDGRMSKMLQIRRSGDPATMGTVERWVRSGGPGGGWVDDVYEVWENPFSTRKKGPRFPFYMFAS